MIECPVGRASPEDVYARMPRLRDVVESMRDCHDSRIVCRAAGKPSSRTFAECYADAEALARGLRTLGIGAGDVVAIHGVTSYSWFIGDLACVLTGAVSLALYPGAPAERVGRSAREMRARALLSDDRARLGELCPDGAVGVWLSEEVRDGVVSVGSLVRLGRQTAQGPGRPDGPDGPFSIVSTSGTLSEPKFFAVHAAPLLYTAERFHEGFRLSSSDSLLIFLPLAHLPQRMLAFGAIRARYDIILSTPTRFLKDAAAASPTVHVVVPRVLEQLAQKLGEAEAAWWFRLVRPLALLAGRLPGRPPLHRLLGVRPFGPRARCIFVGSAPTPPPVMERLRRWGFPIFEVYGTTELGILAMNTYEQSRPGTVGRPVPWGEMTLDEQTREVLFSTPLPFLFGRVEDGEVVPDPEFGRTPTRTGDVGEFDADGYLKLSGRIRDFVALLSGEKIFVAPIERLLERVPGVSHCVLVGNGQKHLSAILFAAPDVLASVGEAAFESRLLAGLKAVNAELHPWERIKQYRLVHEPPTVESGCLTETMKLRRAAVEAGYGRDYASVR